MTDFVAMIRDEMGRGVIASRVEGWEPSTAYRNTTCVHLMGGGVLRLFIEAPEFVQRLDRALTALVNAPAEDETIETEEQQ